MRALAPLAAVYGAALAAREACLEAGLRSRWALPCPVVSVGNLTMGGTSKTPLVIWLAVRLQAAGLGPGVALRGYGGDYDQVAEIVSDPGVPGAARRWGDEARLLALRLPGVPVAVARDRALAALALISAAGARSVLLDDGFQHRRLHRDLDILTLDARAPLGNGRLIPAGPLREPAAAARRARVVVLSRWSESPEAARRESESAARRLCPEATLARCSLRAAGLLTPEGDRLDSARLARDGCFAFCGIARPESFRALLLAAGVEPRGWRAYGDHHAFTPLDLDGVTAEAARLGAGWLVTTEKDAARLEGWTPRASGLAVLRVEAEVDPEEAVLKPVLEACKPVAGP